MSSLVEYWKWTDTILLAFFVHYSWDLILLWLTQKKKILMLMRKELGILNIKITLLDVKLRATILDPTQEI